MTSAGTIHSSARGLHYQTYTAKAVDCNACALSGPCLRGPIKPNDGRGRQVSRFEAKPKDPTNPSERMRQAIDSPRGRQLYSQRFGTVEPVFGNLRHNKRLTRLNHRGRTKVNRDQAQRRRKLRHTLSMNAQFLKTEPQNVHGQDGARGKQFFYSLVRAPILIAKAFVVALALAMLWSNPGYARCVSAPVEAAKIFYTQHENFYFQNPKNVGALVAPRLLAALKFEYACSQGQVCAIDAVPWTDAQDGDVAAPITFKAVEQTATHAVVEMRYTFVINESHRRQQQVHLVFERSEPSACWLLSDLVEPSGNSLVAHLENWRKDFGNGR